MRNRKPLTPEQEAKRDARRARFTELARKVAAMTEDERAQLAASLPSIMTVEGRLLTIHNACLLACQLPTVTMVGGYRQWQAAGRQVRKGEHGLMLWAPRNNGNGDAQPATQGEITAADIQTDRRPNFVMVTVFDVTQTDPIAA